MVQNKHKTKRRIICILCASIIALYALAIPIGAVVNSSQVPDGSTALYGQSTFPYSVGFVCSDANLDRNYIFATEIGSYGLNNNQTNFGEDQFEWYYPDSTDSETSLIEYSGVDQRFLRDTLHWYSERGAEYGTTQGNTYGGFGQMQLEYYTNTQDFVDNVESIIFKASDVYYNPIWLTRQVMEGRYVYLENPSPTEFMMPAVQLPILDDYTTKAFVGAYSVECSILDDRGETHYISYSIPIDTRTEVLVIPFIEYSALKPYMVLNNDGSVNDDQSSKTLLITEYRGYLDVDYYEYVEPEPEVDALAGTWVLNDVLNIEDFSENVYNVSFVSNSTQYGKMFIGFYFDAEIDYLIYSSANASWGEGLEVYNDVSWLNNAYKTISITSNLSDVTNGSTLLTWLQANATKQGSNNNHAGSPYSLAEEGTWEIVSDSREKNKVLVTFPMYDTADSQGISESASFLIAYPSATKFFNTYRASIDIEPEYPTYDEIPEDMYYDYTGWLGDAVGGFMSAQIFPGITIGGMVGVLVMFGCAIALLKIFAGG